MNGPPLKNQAAPVKAEATEETPAVPPDALGAFDEEAPWEPSPGPALDVSGRLEGRAPPAFTSQAASGPVLSPEPEAPLELELRPKPPPPAEVSAPPEESIVLPGRYDDSAPLPPPGNPVVGLLKLLVVLVALGALAVYGLAWWKGRSPQVAVTPPAPKSRAAVPPSRILWIESEPSGAEVHIAGKKVGTTPFAADNLYGAGSVQVELSLRGYQRWAASFEGGKEQRLHAELRRR